MSKSVVEKISEYLGMLAIVLLVVAYPVGMASVVFSIPVLNTVAGACLLSGAIVSVFAVCVGVTTL